MRVVVYRLRFRTFDRRRQNANEHGSLHTDIRAGDTCAGCECSFRPCDALRYLLAAPMQRQRTYVAGRLAGSGGDVTLFDGVKRVRSAHAPIRPDGLVHAILASERFSHVSPVRGSGSFAQHDPRGQSRRWTITMCNEKPLSPAASQSTAHDGRGARATCGCLPDGCSCSGDVVKPFEPTSQSQPSSAEWVNRSCGRFMARVQLNQTRPPWNW
jgi:hypothetical protein